MYNILYYDMVWAGKSIAYRTLKKRYYPPKFIEINIFAKISHIYAQTHTHTVGT
jgi:hypothetical protein